MNPRSRTPVLRRRYDFERRSIPLGVWVLAIVLLAAFTEVWQATRVSELSIDLERKSAALGKAEARRDALEAQLAAHRTRTALEARARSLGMKPAEPEQIVVVPSAWLAAGPEREEGAGGALVAFGRKVAETVVPSARARTRPLSN